MSDVRVPIEKEYDNPKRHPGAGNFNDLLAGRGSPPAANQFSLMSSFIDEAFEDCKLDDNELAGMKVLAGMTPAGQPAALKAECQVPSQPAPPDKARCEDKAPTGPAACPPVDEHKPTNFNADVAKTLDKSKDWDSGEQMVLRTAQRLICAAREQQMAFTEQLCKFMSDGDIDESTNAEGSRLDAFVDGLFASSAPFAATSSPSTEHPMLHQQGVIQDVLSEALSNNRLSEGEWAALRALLDGPTSAHRNSEAVPAHRPERPFDPATTAAARQSRWIDDLVASGGISYETGERAKGASRRRSE
jgi:hypothetical protein